MTLTDTHTHLYAEQFDGDRDEMIQRAFDAGVTRLFLPNIDLDSIDGMMNLVNKYPDNCFPMMGLHPCSVIEDNTQQLEVIKKHLFNSSDKFCAVGEIGLDYYWDTSFKKQQIELFKLQIEWAKELAKPIVIHCRDSFDDIVMVLKEVKDERLTGVFHCFTGTLEQAQEVIDLGFYLGIGGVVTFKNSGLAEVVKDVDLKHILLETDSPYLTPSPYRGKRNESSYVKYVAEKIAGTKDMEVKDVAEITTATSVRLFKV